MNNLQLIIKDNSRYAMHVAVELCEQGDFDSVTEAFKWLMQERDDSELGSEREKALEELVQDWQVLYENRDLGDCVRLRKRMQELGIEVIDE